MSTDLEFRQSELPEIRLQPIQTRSSSSSSTTSPRCSFRDGNLIEFADDDDVKRQVLEDEEDDENQCATPTSDEHKIPVALTCPPAPIKPRKRSILCKRKLSELKFFENENIQYVPDHQLVDLFTTTTMSSRSGCFGSSDRQVLTMMSSSSSRKIKKMRMNCNSNL